jgi:hypothetical protein
LVILHQSGATSDENAIVAVFAGGRRVALGKPRRHTKIFSF